MNAIADYLITYRKTEISALGSLVLRPAEVSPHGKRKRLSELLVQDGRFHISRKYQQIYVELKDETLAQLHDGENRGHKKLKIEPRQAQTA